MSKKDRFRALDLYMDQPSAPEHPAPPADALIRHDDGTLEYQGASLSRVGLFIPEDFGKYQWQELGRILSQIDTSLMWWVGDWIVYGEGLGYGEAQTVAEALGIQVQNIYDYSYVSRYVQFSVRTENLSWSHHKLVAKLPPDQQHYWLTTAEREGWSLKQMKQAMRGDTDEQGRVGGSIEKALTQITYLRHRASDYPPAIRQQLITELEATLKALRSV